MRPVRAKALIINAFALTGRFAFIYLYTQDAALGYVLIGLSARFVYVLDAPRECLSRAFCFFAEVSAIVPFECCSGCSYLSGKREMFMAHAVAYASHALVAAMLFAVAQTDVCQLCVEAVLVGIISPSLYP